MNSLEELNNLNKTTTISYYDLRYAMVIFENDFISLTLSLL